MTRKVAFTGETLTKESFGQVADINALAARALAGQPIPMNGGIASFGDCTHSLQLEDAIELTRNIDRTFAAIPPEIRAEFRNDPVALVKFLDEVIAEVPGARARAIPLGLVNPTADENRYIKAVSDQAAKDKLAAESASPSSPSTALALSGEATSTAPKGA